MTLTELRAGTALLVEAEGGIDSTTADALRERLVSLFDGGEKRLALDLSRVAYLSSIGFRALLVAHRAAERAGAAFILFGMSSRVRALFEMGGLLDHFVVRTDRADALSALR